MHLSQFIPIPPHPIIIIEEFFFNLALLKIIPIPVGTAQPKSDATWSGNLLEILKTLFSDTTE